jgi:hypothetical protein
MRHFLILAATVLLTVPALAGDEAAHPMGTPSGWFDFENCAFCKNLATDPELLHHTTWETHAIADGMMTIIAVEPAYAESMARASAAMAKLGADMESGKVNPMATKMCGSCQEYGMLMMAGVTTEQVKGEAAEVMLMTSDDPALVKRLHAMVERNNEEMALMMASGKEHAGHDGHGHAHDGHDH